MPRPFASRNFLDLDSRAWFGRLFICAILVAPSIWMLISQPPLWRDVDAYAQVVYPAGTATIIRHGPLYCFLARVPLFFGFAFECARLGLPGPSLGFVQHPVLCDAGVFLLLLLQHLALGVAGFTLIRVAAKRGVIRLALAVLWASNPLFYSLAHCVGSETLSLLLIIFSAVAGMVVIRHVSPMRRRDWIWFGLLVIAAILCRFINAVLLALLPLAFTLAFARSIGRRVLGRRSGDAEIRHSARRLGLSLALGVACLAATFGTMRVLCRLNDLPARAGSGYTFLWRLKFLDRLTPDTRDRVVASAEAKASSPDATLVLQLLRARLQLGPALENVGTFLEEARAPLPAQSVEIEEARLDQALNEIMRTFLMPPDKELLAAARADFLRNVAVPGNAAVSALFEATNYYFANPEMMPGCAKLSTYRDRTPLPIHRIFRKHGFFSFWKNCSYALFFFSWLAGLLVLGGLRLSNDRASSPFFISYPVALTVTGQLLLLASCLLTDPTARFTVPCWALTIVSAVFVFGQLGDVVVGRDGRAEKSPPGGYRARLRSPASSPLSC